MDYSSDSDSESNTFSCCDKELPSIYICIHCQNVFHKTCLEEKGNKGLPSCYKVQCCEDPLDEEVTMEIENLNRVIEDTSFEYDPIMEKNRVLEEKVGKLQRQINNIKCDIESVMEQLRKFAKSKKNTEPNSETKGKVEEIEKLTEKLNLHKKK